MQVSELQLLENVRFWRNLLPDFSISDEGVEWQASQISLDEGIVSNAADCLNEEGYFLLNSVLSKEVSSKLARGVTALAARGVLPVFAFLYDEYWLAFKSLSSVLRSVVGSDYVVVPEFWAWHIEEGVGSAGFAPHRDQNKRMQCEDGGASLISIWIPFVDVDPYNSCMYVVPKHLDQNFPGNLENHHIDGHSVVALPAPAGSIIGWDANLIHWGGRSTRYAKGPRISYGFSIMRPHRDPSYHVALNLEQSIPFEMRLKLIATQLKIYQARYQYAALVNRFIDKYSINNLIT